MSDLDRIRALERRVRGLIRLHDMTVTDDLNNDAAALLKHHSKGDDLVKLAATGHTFEAYKQLIDRALVGQFDRDAGLAKLETLGTPPKQGESWNQLADRAAAKLKAQGVDLGPSGDPIPIDPKATPGEPRRAPGNAWDRGADAAAKQLEENGIDINAAFDE